MKNYVVWTNCLVSETQAQFGIQPVNDPASRQAYDHMFKVSQASARKFLAGDWESIVFTDPAETRVHIFRDNWQRIWDLWHKEPCNILYLDSDAMFIKPTDMFGRFNEFRMFNWTDPKSNGQFENYYNAGVRYYPSSMTPEVWEIGQNIAKNWNMDIWDQEQLIFNTMFWSQNVPDPHHPEFNWQGMHMRLNNTMQTEHEGWNQLKVGDAHIMHMHGSRSATATAGMMTAIANQFEINLD